MKTKILTTVMLLLLFIGGVGSQEVKVRNGQEEPVKIFTTPASRDLTELWITEYGNKHPDFKFQLTPVGLAGLNQEMTGDHSIGFVMQQPDVSLSIESMWMITVGREVIVAVMNDENPYLGALLQKGISPRELAKTLTGQLPKSWGPLLENDISVPLSMKVLDEPEVKLSVSKFLELDPSDIMALNVVSKDEFIASVANDKYAIGFCRLAMVADSEKKQFVSDLRPLPIDRNNNGRLDYNENIYENFEQFERSVWIGKYPRSLVYNVYAVAPEFPANEHINNLLSWIVTSGQQLAKNGELTELFYTEKQSNLEKLAPSPVFAENQAGERSVLSVFLWVTLIVFAIVILLTVIVHIQNRKRSRAPLLSKIKHATLLSQEMLSFPKGLYFDKTHTWVFMEKKGKVKVGIDDFIPNVTGDYTRLILKDPGETVKRMEPLVTLIQKGKQITINSPVSGTVREINETLVADPFMVNVSPYGEGWIYKIEPSNWFREIQFFKLGESYRKWISDELIRLKDFLACSFNISNLQDGKLAFQEGGEILIYPLKELEPKTWEDFQCHFINTSDMF